MGLNEELPLLLWTPEEFADAVNNGVFDSHGRVQMVNGMVWCEDHCADRRAIVHLRERPDDPAGDNILRAEQTGATQGSLPARTDMLEQA